MLVPCIHSRVRPDLHHLHAVDAPGEGHDRTEKRQSVGFQTSDVRRQRATAIFQKVPFAFQAGGYKKKNSRPPAARCGLLISSSSRRNRQRAQKLKEQFTCLRAPQKAIKYSGSFSYSGMCCCSKIQTGSMLNRPTSLEANPRRAKAGKRCFRLSTSTSIGGEVKYSRSVGETCDSIDDLLCAAATQVHYSSRAVK